VTEPHRKLVWLDAELQAVDEYVPPQGSFLVDFAVHPSGAVTLLEILPAAGNDVFVKPIQARLTRISADGSQATLFLEAEPLPDPGGASHLLFSLDRARVAAFGEENRVAVRWSDNSVQLHGVELRSGELQKTWTAVAEPAANLFPLGIIGGGFDNFHQGDSVAFVYLDVDETGASYVAAPSTVDVLPAHDAFFHEDLSSRADPANFDYGVSIVTRFSPAGQRTYSVLSGLGTNKRLLNLRATSANVFLAGRVKTGNQPGSWDAWVETLDASNGRALSERFVDVQSGDMFWDLAPLDGGSLLAVGSTNYTQNPSGLSVSDPRDDLAVIVGPDGVVRQRIALPAGPAGRGNEVVSVRIIEGGWAMFAGLNDAPGTHAAVYSDAFLFLRPLPF
jgi:hypothetical protein